MHADDFDWVRYLPSRLSLTVVYAFGQNFLGCFSYATLPIERKMCLFMTPSRLCSTSSQFGSMLLACFSIC